MSNESAFLYIDSIADKVSGCCHQLLKSTPISMFSYHEVDYENNHVVLTTNPDSFKNVSNEKLFPSSIEMDMYRRLNQKITMFSHMISPPRFLSQTAKERVLANIDVLAAFNYFHRFFLIEFFDNKLQIAEFGVSLDQSSILNFYMNNLFEMQQFVSKFQRQAEELISEMRLGYVHKIPNFYEIYDVDISNENVVTQDVDIEFNWDSYSDRTVLTARECECVELIAKGYTMKMVASKFDLSPRTIEQHLRNAKDKLGLYTKKQLVEYWHGA